MRRVLPLLLIVACTAGAGSETTTTTSPCVEARVILAQAVALLDDAADAANRVARAFPTERAAVVTEMFPQCFSVDERVDAETRRRLIAYEE